MRMADMKAIRDSMKPGDRVTCTMFGEPWSGTYEGPTTDGTVRGLVRFDNSRRATPLGFGNFHRIEA